MVHQFFCINQCRPKHFASIAPHQVLLPWACHWYRAAAAASSKWFWSSPLSHYVCSAFGELIKTMHRTWLTFSSILILFDQVDTLVHDCYSVSGACSLWQWYMQHRSVLSCLLPETPHPFEAPNELRIQHERLPRSQITDFRSKFKTKSAYTLAAHLWASGSMTWDAALKHSQKAFEEVPIDSWLRMPWIETKGRCQRAVG